MKRFSVFACFLMLTVVLSCNQNAKCEIRIHDSLEDVIRFNGINWLEHREKVYDELKSIFSEDLIEEYKGTNNYTDTLSEDIYLYTVPTERGESISVGGYIVDSIIVSYIHIGSEDCLYSANYFFSRDKMSRDVYNDILDKLKAMYDNRTQYREHHESTEETQVFMNHWTDENNNEIEIFYYNNTMYLKYNCNDVDVYINTKKEEYKASSLLHEPNNKGL